MAERLRLLLDWKLDAKHALFVEGLERGAYARAGIALELIEPQAKSIQALELLHRGGAELAINYPHNLLLSARAVPGPAVRGRAGPAQSGRAALAGGQARCAPPPIWPAGAWASGPAR